MLQLNLRLLLGELFLQCRHRRALTLPRGQLLLGDLAGQALLLGLRIGQLGFDTGQARRFGFGCSQLRTQCGNLLITGLQFGAQLIGHPIVTLASLGPRQCKSLFAGFGFEGFDA